MSRGGVHGPPLSTPPRPRRLLCARDSARVEQQVPMIPFPADARGPWRPRTMKSSRRGDPEGFDIASLLGRRSRTQPVCPISLRWRCVRQRRRTDRRGRPRLHRVVGCRRGRRLRPRRRAGPADAAALVAPGSEEVPRRLATSGVPCPSDPAADSGAADVDLLRMGESQSAGCHQLSFRLTRFSGLGCPISS